MEFTINGVDYRTAKLSVFDQLKVSRKLLPVLAGIAGNFSKLKEAAATGDMAGVLESALPQIASAIAELPDESVDAIIHPCLAVVSRQHMKAWIPVFTAGELAFDDVDLYVMLQLVARVVADSLGNFLHALPTSETAAPPAA